MNLRTKMESGEKPERSRHCKPGAISKMPLRNREGAMSNDGRARRHASIHSLMKR